ncbi:DUF6531 domain-containing protein [Ralstonia edaphi]|uniref:DUF6531 domain-containing protein n=1 Tax=Ralstonia edaphi TaxID=3058599 RepID=UPI00292E2351|nr:DUF6531 domain-containing protein [Ralstonia sp. LMG 6871]
MRKRLQRIASLLVGSACLFISSAFAQSQCTVDQINAFNAQCNATGAYVAGLEASCLVGDPSHYICGFYPLPSEVRKTPTGLACVVLWVRSPSGQEGPIPSAYNTYGSLDCTVPSDIPIATKNAGDACSPQSDCGNPINVGVGNKHQREVDYVGSGRFPLQIARTYNSNSIASGGFGPGWRLAYRQQVNYSPPASGSSVDTAVLTRGDGKQYYFSRTGGVGAPWVSDADVTGRLSSLGSTATPTGWTFVNAQDGLESYDADGRLVSLTNRDGATQTLAYSCTALSATCPSLTPASVAPIAGLLVSVTDPTGRQLNFTYDQVARIKTITDPAGGVYTYTYASGVNTANLTSVTYPDGAVRTYLYNESGNVSSSPASGVDYSHALTGIRDENGGRYVTWRYDANGRAYSSEHGTSGADRVAMAYNADGSSAVVDALGTKRTYNFATSLGTVRNVGITGQPCDGCFQALTYDANGNVTSKTDFNGNVACLNYDLIRNLEIARVEGLPAGTVCPSSLDGFTVPPGARKISTQWHSTWRTPVGIAEPGRITTYVYNGDNGALCAPSTAVIGSGGAAIGVQCSQTVQPTSDTTGGQGFNAAAAGASRATQWTYGADGQVLAVKGPRNDTTTQSYRTADDTNSPPQYRKGDLYQIVDALGHTTTINQYDPNGRPLQMTDANGAVTTFTYSNRGWLTDQTVTPSGGAGQTTAYVYDKVGQLTKVTQPDGATVSFSYDDAHRLVGAADSSGNNISYTLDAMGNRTQEQAKDPSGNLARQITRVFDSINRPLQVTLGTAPPPNTPPPPPPSPKVMPMGVSASASYGSNTPEKAMDGDASTAWTAPGYAPQWIEVDLGSVVPLKKLRMLVSQSPAGQTTHVVTGDVNPAPTNVLQTFSGNTTDGQWLEYSLDSVPVNVRYIRVTTTASPSWVSWREFEFYR